MKRNFQYSRVTGCETADDKSKPHLYLPDGSIVNLTLDESGSKGSSSQHGLPTREIDFEQLPDGRLAEIVEDPQNPKRSLLAFGRDDSYQIVKYIKCETEILVPLPRCGEFLRDVILPKGIEPVKVRTGVAPPEVLAALVYQFIRERAALDPAHLSVLTFFVISTWFVDRFDVAPYLLIVGPPQSGKTTLLNVLALLCRRPLLIGDISSAALYRTISRIHPTLLLDESTTQVGMSGRALRHLLRVGSTRQGVARMGEMFDCFGVKVIAAPEPPNDAALNSRCIIVPMLRANPEKKDLGTPAVRSHAEVLRQGLLRWRLNRWASIQPARVPGSESLPPRAQDLLSCLAAAAPTQGGRDYLLEYFKRTSANVDEDRSTVLTRLMNSVLGKIIHVRTEGDANDLGPTSYVMVTAFTDTVNQELKLRGERYRLSPEEVGHTLTALGLTNRGRTNRGMRLWMDLTTRRRIHLNAKTLGQEKLLGSYGPQMEACPLCEEDSLAALLGDLPIPTVIESPNSSNPAQNPSAPGSPKANGIDRPERAAKSSRTPKVAHHRQASRSKRRSRIKK